MADDNETVATITQDNPYASRSKPVGPARPTYDRSVKIKDMGKGAEPGHNSPAAPFVNPDPNSKHRF